MSEKKELDLDRALASGRRPDDPELGSLYDSATGFKDSLPAEAPGSHMNRALFVQSVGARRRRFGPMRFLVPALACLILLAGVAILGRTAAPGDDLYSVRTALQAVGLADSPEEEADELIADANGALKDARSLVLSDPVESQRLTLVAIADLDRARRLLRDETGVARQLSLITTLENRAVNLLVQIASPPPATPAESDDDNSGPGSGDEDNSGPGGGGGDDNSGPGGGDDSSGDNSGPGGGGDDTSGSGGGGDSSGPGSGDDSDGDDSDGDNSGPGGGGGDDDSSGSGSGGDGSGSGSGDGDNSGPG